MHITAPGQFQLFRDGHIGQDARIVTISSSSTPNVLAQAHHFFDRTNDEIQLVDGNNRIFLTPRSKSVRATFVDGTRNAQYLPTGYISYNLTFSPSEVNNDDTWRTISSFSNAENLIIGSGFEVKSGYERKIQRLSSLHNLRELVVFARPSSVTVNLSTFLDAAPAVRDVRIVVAGRREAEQLAEHQCPPPTWAFGTAVGTTVKFEKSTGNPDYRSCWERQHYPRWSSITIS